MLHISNRMMIMDIDNINPELVVSRAIHALTVCMVVSNSELETGVCKGYKMFVFYLLFTTDRIHWLKLLVLPWIIILLAVSSNVILNKIFNQAFPILTT